MLFEVLFAGSDEFDGGKLVSPLLEAADNRADQSALDTIRLDAGELLVSSRSLKRVRTQ